MTITESVLANSSNTNAGAADSVNTASITPSAPVIAFVTLTAATTAPQVPTLSGAATWSAISGASIRLSAATARSMFAFTGIASFAASAVTITKNAGDGAGSITGFNWTILQMTGSHPAIPARQAAVISDTDWDLADTQTATLAAAVLANSKCFAGAFINVTTDVLEQGSGLTQIDQHSVSTPSMELHTSWTAGDPQVSGSYTQTGADNGVGGLIFVEVQNAEVLMTMGLNIGF